MSERRLQILSDLADQIRQRDFVFALLGAGAGFLIAASTGGPAWLGGLIAAGCAGGSVAIRHAIGARALARNTADLDGKAQHQLSLTTAEALIEHLPDPLILIDGEGRILFSNGAAQSLLAIGSARRHISAVVRAPGVLEAIRLVLAGSGPQQVDYAIPVPVERYLRAFVAPIPLQSLTGASANGAVLMLHDLTSQKRLERMRADFVANASHELRTPLASLAGYIETLQGHARDDPEARERFLSIMSEQAGRMKRLIEDLLSLSRIELNEHVRPKKAIDLAGVVRDVLDAFAPQIDEQKVELSVDIAGSLKPVAGERDELIQVVQNLFDNALKYGGGIVEVRVAESPPVAALPGGQPTQARVNFVAIRDHGDGIPREHLPRLTERFYRVDVQRSRETGGTGLGLAIVKHILNRHRGWMTIDSQLGEGSTFTIYLPWAGEPAQPEQEFREAEPAA